MTTKPKVGIIGLGDMGGNIADVLLRHGHQLVLYNRTKEKYFQFKENKNIHLATDLKDMVENLKNEPKIVWAMLPAGEVTKGIVSEISAFMRKGDIVIDGSNASYKESIITYKHLQKSGIHYLDLGCGGGPNDVLNGKATLMIGGDYEAYRTAESIFESVSYTGRNIYVGGSGSGHLLKFAHNAEFYAQLAAAAETTVLLKRLAELEPGMNLNFSSAVGALASCPPINGEINETIAEACNHNLQDRLPEKIKVSEIVKQGLLNAANMGVAAPIISKMIEGYESMSDGTKRILAPTKEIITGHPS